MNNHIQERYIYFSIYFLFSTILIFSGNTTFGGVWDDHTAWNILKEGDPRTLILSYPLSLSLTKLYAIFPKIQWYSLVIFMVMLFNMYLTALIIEKIKYKNIKIYLFIFYTILFSYFWINMSITLLTGYIFFLILPIFFFNYTLFLIGLLIATLLRNEILIIYIPLIVIILFIFNNYIKKLTKNEVILTSFTVILISLTFLSVNFDSQYKTWLTFNSARGYFLDSKTKVEILQAQLDNKITEKERMLLLAWWVQDSELLSSNKILNAAGGILDKWKSSRFYYKDIFLHQYNYLIIFLLIASFYLLFLLFNKKDYKKILFFSLFIIYITLIFIIRDVERVTFPLLVSWIFVILMYYHFTKNHVTIQFFSLIFITIILIISIEKYYLYNHNKPFIKSLKQEFKKITQPHEYKLEVSLSFPYGKYNNHIDMLFKDQSLFFEENWLLLSKENILLPFGWFSRHPLFYQMHNINFGNKKRQFPNYYKFMINSKTAFIGEKGLPREILKKNILTMYNEKYISNTKCYHDVVLLKETKHFTISQIQKKCTKPHTKGSK